MTLRSADNRHLVEVDAHDAQRARASSTVMVWRGSTEDADGPQGRPIRGAQLLGEFDDQLQFEAADGCWRIAQRQARFVLHTGEPGQSDFLD